MRRGYLLLLACVLLTMSFLPALAEPPVPLAQVAPLEDLVLEVDDRIKALEKLLASEESFEENKETAVWQGFTVLAVIGQGIAEHPDHGKTKIQGPHLRDAARQFTAKSSYDEAKAALEAVTKAHTGGASGDASVEHDWAKLVRMHPMMYEIEERSGSLNRVIRRPRGRADEPVHASVIALLTLAMHADTHEVKNPDEIPQWHALAREYLDTMTGVAKAVRQKDKETAGELMVKATATCDKCHEKFRD